MLDDKTKINIKSNSSSPIHIGLPQSSFSRTWQPGATYPIAFELVREMIYDDGAKYFFDQGMLSMENKEARIELGLETEEPIPNFKPKRILNKSQMLKLWKTDSLDTFKEVLNEVNFEQMQALADFAVTNKIVDFAKAEYFKKYTQIDVVTALNLLQE